VCALRTLLRPPLLDLRNCRQLVVPLPLLPHHHQCGRCPCCCHCCYHCCLRVQPVGLLSVLPSIFIVGANTFVRMAPMAHKLTIMVTALLIVAALVATWVCALVFPEYCVDVVRRHSCGAWCSVASLV
jgi:hypothetical protein